MKKRILIVCIVFVAFLFASSVFASTGSWTPSFTSANKEKYMYGVSGTLKKYVSYAKGTMITLFCGRVDYAIYPAFFY